MATKLRKLAVVGLTGTVGACFASYLLLKENGRGSWPTVSAGASCPCPKAVVGPIPTRADQIKSLQSEEYDILIIGGGITGAGCALDATTRGLKTALVEGDDFASGTTSRSTKLIHGGVRYLQKAIMELDYDQFKIVMEALYERSIMLEQAPHLTRSLPIMLPVYRFWQVPYFWFGMKLYDLVANIHALKSSYYISKKNALELYPMLRDENLCGGIVYYDGQLDDARMNLAIALSAAGYGATVANHVSVTGLIKQNRDGQEIITGVHLKDEISGQKWDVAAKCVINATGPFTDAIRKMDDCNVDEICSPSSGVHITLPGYYSPEQMGLLDPATSDGRVIFFLPWQNHTIAGTTDLPCEPTHSPQPTEEEISFILEEIKNYLSPDVEVRRGDVLSAWSGVRPLVRDPNKPDTQSLARNHIIHISPSKLVTIAGGKLTTYRSMAAETIDAAVKACSLAPKMSNSQTHRLKMMGADGWRPTMYIRLVQDFGLECEVAQHLAKYYGDRAFTVAKMAEKTGKRWPIIGNKIHPEFPYITAEVKYGVSEYAMTAIDMIARRLRLAFLNVEAALEALPCIVDIMAEELQWSTAEKMTQMKLATDFLNKEMGQNVNRASCDNVAVNLSNEDLRLYVKRFEILDKDRRGYISMNDIRMSLKQYGEQEISGEEFHKLLREIDTSLNGRIDLQEYLQMMSAIKSGHVTYSVFAKIAKTEGQSQEQEMLKKPIPVERSGGGV